MVKQNFSLRNGYVVIFGLLLNIGTSQATSALQYSTAAAPAAHRGAARQMYGSGSLRPPGTRQPPIYATGRRDHGSRTTPPSSQDGPPNLYRSPYQPTFDVQHYPRVPLPVPLHELEAAGYPFYLLPAPGMVRLSDRPSLRGGQYGGRPEYYQGRPQQGGLFLHDLGLVMGRGFDKRIATMLGPVRRRGNTPIEGGQMTLDETTGNLHHPCGEDCARGEYLCIGSCTCIPNEYRCDGDVDCQGQEDELECGEPELSDSKRCEESSKHVRCPTTGRCIAREFLCDGDDDCGDYSDETKCGTRLKCNEDQFECNNGLCIPNNWLCDTDNDCKDFSDEFNCSKIGCTKDEFECGDGTCISLTWKCDKEVDCSDESDETDCDILPSCNDEEFQCSSDKCIKRIFRCDGDNDCGDWSDESECEIKPDSCLSGEFKCENGKCIPERYVCDKQQDCDNNEDEDKCENVPLQSCSPDEHVCDSGACILKTWVCDGFEDCSRGEDELSCDIICDDAKYPCQSLKNNKTAFCINKKHVCDGQKDCPRGEDEMNCPTKIDCAKDSKCEQLCLKTHEGKDACNCRAGYRLADDEYSCEDINECLYATDPVCSQTCNNTIGSFRCGCMTGYILRPDLRSCKASGAPPTLLFANRKDIRQVSLSSTKYTAILKGLQNAIALDYHYEQGLIFWSDVSMDVIRRAYINGTDIIDVISSGLESPAGLAVDWIHGLLFWTDSGTRRVEVSTLDGRARHVVAARDLDKPRAIAVHPGRGLLLWTDWGPRPRIERSDMDGGNRKSLITESVFWPNGLAVDYTSERIYWADAKHNVIETATLDGADRRKVISKGLPHPFAITLFEDAIYWTDWHTKSISTANKVTGAGLRTIHSQLHFPMDIRSYHPQRQPQYPNRCAGNCDHLCLPTSEGHKCVCRLGQRLRSNKRGCQHPERLLLFSRNKDLRILNLPTSDQDASADVDYKEHHMVIPVEGVKSAVAIAWDSHTDSIFWTDIERDTINRAFWNGTGHQILIQTNLASPAGLAFDWLTNKLYWTDSINCRIEVSNSDGSLRALLIWKDLYEPRDIALDPLNGYMYWTVWGNKSRIERAAMDGTMRTVILDTNLTWPNGLAIDYEAKKLYWADAGTRTIEYSDLNGSHRHLLLDGGPESHPFGLDVHGRGVFWTDWRSRRIERVDKLHGTDRTVLVSDLSDLMDVRVFHRERSYVGTPCNSKNGGCSHLCLLKPGGTQCACPIGITLADDGKTCSSGPVNYLIFARRVDIRQISLDVPYTMDAVLPFTHLKSATSVDVDRKTGEIYWTDTAEDVIEKASPDGQNVKTVIMHELEAPDGLAVDSTGRKIYWTDRVRNSIEVAELNGGNRKVLFCTHLDNPRAITLHYNHGLVFWTDWGKSAKIEVAHMDGTNRQVLITKNLVWPNGLAIDRPMERLYWNDGKLNVIESSDLNGMNRRIVRSKVKHPYGLVVVGSHIYWTDWQTQSLHRADKNDGSDMTVIRDKLEGLMDVRSVQADNIEENACGDNNGGCSHLCLRNPTGYTCACPTGIKMSENNNKKCKIQPDSYILIATRYSLSRISLDFEDLWDVTLQLKDVQNLIGVDFHWKKKMIFYTDIGKNVIGSINMNDISEMKPVIKEDLLSPDGIAIDWLADNLYWTNTGKKLIEVSRFDGSSRKILIRDSLDDPRSITVYPRKAYLFWSDWGQPRIERSLLDGSSRRVLIGELLSFPIGLAIDYSLDRLYWIDAKLKAERVEASDLHGRFREFLEYMPSTHPFSLVTHGRYIYWTDWAQKAILRADKNTGKDSRVLRSHLDAAMGLTVVAAERQRGWNPCMMDNGGCQHLCFYTVKNYSCGCSDQQPNCKTEPISAVPLSCPGPPHDCAHWDDPSTAVDEHYIHPSLFAPPSGSDSPSSAATTPSSLLYAVTLVPALSVMALCIALALYLMTRRSREGYPYARGSGRGPGRGFSNPNYCSNAAGQDQQPGGQGGERKQRMWKRLKYDKSQERVYEETTGTNSPEVLSLIPTVLTPCSSNCEPVTPELERSPLATPMHKSGEMVTQLTA